MKGVAQETPEKVTRANMVDGSIVRPCSGARGRESLEADRWGKRKRCWLCFYPGEGRKMEFLFSPACWVSLWMALPPCKNYSKSHPRFGYGATLFPLKKL